MGENSPGSWHITAALMLATLITVLDTTIAIIALPHMGGTFGASSEQVSWVLTSYIVATAIFTLPTGYFAHRFGRRRVLIVSMGLFVLSSMLCGQAGSLPEMVIWRLLQGAAGAAIIPISQVIMLDSFPREQHTTAMAIWGVGIMVGPILGPVLGGWLTDVASWRWVFYVNLPLGILSLFLLYLYIPESPKMRDRFDFKGFLLLSVFVACVQLALDRGEQVDWWESLEIKLYSLLAGVAAYFYWVRDVIYQRPFFNRALYKDWNFMSASFCMAVIFSVHMGSMALLPSLLQQWQGYPVVEAGFVMISRGVGAMVSMMIVSRVIRYVDERVLVALGLACAAFGTYALSVATLEMSADYFIWTGFVYGLGIGFVVVPISTILYATLDIKLRAEAASLYVLSRNIGGSIGISFFVAMLSREMWYQNQQMMGQLNPVVLAERLGSANPPEAAVASVFHEVSRQAAEVAYVNDFTLQFWTLLALMPLVLLFRNARH